MIIFAYKFINMNETLFYPGDILTYDSFGDRPILIRVIRIYNGTSWSEETENPDDRWFIECETLDGSYFDGFSVKIAKMAQKPLSPFYKLSLVERTSVSIRKFVTKHKLV
jgi:hypothetical protein